MKSLFFLLLVYLLPAKEDKVLICKSAGAYAYHSYQCRGLKACTHSIKTVTLQEAVSLRRKPCEICYDVKSLPTTPSNNLQCGAITKKGSQCSWKATADGYCWQHGK